ncbi:hypothetical protein E4U55_007490 [Claviceps digitariae]|nr:hypothetical protein E4U55_007490 [Claviceps digitariae]
MPSLLSLCLSCLSIIPLSHATTPNPPALLSALGQDADLSILYHLFNSTGGSSGTPAPDLEDRFNNPRDGLYRIVFAPTNSAFAALPPATLARLTQPTSYELLVALLRTHLSDPVTGPLAVEALPDRTFRSVEGFQLLVAGNGSVVSNPGVLSSDPDNVPLPAPQANLVRRASSSSSVNSSGPFLQGIQAANGAIFKIDSLINPFATFFGRDHPRSASLPPPVVLPNQNHSAVTMADVLSSDEDLTGLHDILTAIAPDFVQRLALFPHDTSGTTAMKTTTTTTTMVFLAPGNNTTLSRVESATWPFNAGLSRHLLLGGFGELRGQTDGRVGIEVAGTDRTIAVQGDVVGNARVPSAELAPNAASQKAQSSKHGNPKHNAMMTRCNAIRNHLKAMTRLSSLLGCLALLANAHADAITPPHNSHNRQQSSTGCGTKHTFAGKTREFSFDSGGYPRTYRLHLPSRYDAERATPLLLAYHGHGKKVVEFELETRFSDEGVNPDMIAVYPVSSSWQGAPYANPDVDDEAFTMDLIARIKDEFCIDASRVYATGHSNGGGFCNVLACSRDAGPQFAAFAPISGAFYSEFQSNDKCHAASLPRPMLEVHGTADRQIPYDGRASGGHGPLVGIPAWVKGWARRNGCGAPLATDLGRGVHDDRYECGGVADGLEHIRVEGMGHAWPVAGSPLQNVSAKVVEFLNKHRRQ